MIWVIPPGLDSLSNAGVTVLKSVRGMATLPILFQTPPFWHSYFKPLISQVLSKVNVLYCL